MGEYGSMPGDREAAAAIAGMQDTYGRDIAVGCEVRFRLDTWPAGYADTGVVRGLLRSSVIVDTGDAVYVIEPSDILPF